MTFRLARLTGRWTVAAAALALAWATPVHLDREPGRPLDRAEPEWGACLAAGCPEAVRAQRLAQLEDLIFDRMPKETPRTHEQLARALFEEAEAVRIDPLLVLAMIEVESGFDRVAASPVGARGLMQLLPSTMEAQAAKLGLAGADPEDPVANVRAGVRYLRACLDSYPGSVRLALMAYNAGPNRVYELIQSGELPEWALAYPRRVETQLRRLRQVLGDEPGPRFADARAARR